MKSLARARKLGAPTPRGPRTCGQNLSARGGLRAQFSRLQIFVSIEFRKSPTHCICVASAAPLSWAARRRGLYSSLAKKKNPTRCTCRSCQFFAFGVPDVLCMKGTSCNLVHNFSSSFSIADTASQRGTFHAQRKDGNHSPPDELQRGPKACGTFGRLSSLSSYSRSLEQACAK